MGSFGECENQEDRVGQGKGRSGSWKKVLQERERGERWEGRGVVRRWNLEQGEHRHAWGQQSRADQEAH